MKPFNYLANAVRAPEIVAILVRWGFEDLLLKLDTPQFLLRNLVRKKVTDLTPYERVRSACEELGPIFVKFGQILSTRPDRLPEPLVMIRVTSSVSSSLKIGGATRLRLSIVRVTLA